MFSVHFSMGLLVFKLLELSLRAIERQMVKEFFEW